MRPETRLARINRQNAQQALAKRTETALSTDLADEEQQAGSSSGQNHSLPGSAELKDKPTRQRRPPKQKFAAEAELDVPDLGGPKVVAETVDAKGKGRRKDREEKGLGEAGSGYRKVSVSVQRRVVSVGSSSNDFFP